MFESSGVIAGSDKPSLTIEAPNQPADSSNASAFPVSGSGCVSGETIRVTVGAVVGTSACGASGVWNLVLDLTGITDGTHVVTVEIVDQPTRTTTSSVVKSTGTVCVGGATTFTTNMNARYVIGQADFVSNSANRGGAVAANTLRDPVGLTVSNGKLYIADAGNNRVLVFNSLPTSNGGNADVVVGQAGFTTAASGVSNTLMAGIQTVSVAGNYLAVSEWTNARVSLWPLSNLTAATMFLGQPDSTSQVVNNGGISASSLGAAAGLAATATNLYVGDVTNNRIMSYPISTLATAGAASLAIGQSDFITGTAGSGSTGFGNPYSVSTDGTKLAVLDNANDRVMIYNSIPTNGGVADVTWGGYGVTATGLNNPVGVFIGGGKMFIADRSSDRILVFNSIPTSSGQLPDAVLGQSVYTSQAHNQCDCATAAANTLWGVHHVYYDGCRLYVTDKQNHRVLVY